MHLLRTGSLFPTGLPGGSDGKESTCNAGDLGLTPGLGKSLGGGHGNPLQYSCLENPDELWMEVCDIVQESGSKTIPKKKK